MRILKVGKPTFTTFDSISEAVNNPATQARTNRARQDWCITDSMKVQSCSYSMNKLRVHFGPVTLEIVARPSMVNWQLYDALPPLVDMEETSYLLVDVECGTDPMLFDRGAVLQEIVGRRIRYYPSASELYLAWKPNHEIAIFSLPLAEDDGWLLYYS